MDQSPKNPPDSTSPCEWWRAAPPREVPPELLARRLPKGPLRVLLTVAAVAVLASIPLYERLFPKRLFDDLALSFGDPQILYGELIESTALNLKRKTDAGQSAPVQRFRFRFQTADGQSLEGSSHGLTNPTGLREEIPLEVDPDDPSTSRIRGTTCSAEPLTGAFALLFPFVPMVWVFGVLRRRRRIHSLLTNGRFVEAGVEAVEQVRPPGAAGTTRAEVTFAIEASSRRRHRPSAREIQWIEALRASNRPVPVLVDAHDLIVLEPANAEVEEPEDEDPYAD
ncbi:MAG: hypothetical protein AAF196_12675 [Planctomycetota bacterium]